jgi:hypothetical protein
MLVEPKVKLIEINQHTATKPNYGPIKAIALDDFAFTILAVFRIE